MRHARPILCLVVAWIGVPIGCFPPLTVWRASGSLSPGYRRFQYRPTTAAIRWLWEIRASSWPPARCPRPQPQSATEARGGQWFARASCGESDAVWVGIDDGPGSTAVAMVTMADADARSSWPLLAGVGAVVVAGALQ